VLENFKEHINSNFSFLYEKKLLIAISGGLDSVVLAHLCKSLNLNFCLAHCNFSLRGKESDADEAFVTQLAKDLEVNLFKNTFQTEAFAKKEKLSIQLAARKLRYDWFETLLIEENLNAVLTAHHADDNLETILINLSRGTGIDGLTGIPPQNNNIVRPLLPFTREEIKNYALSENIKWREDSSNASTKYVRNKLRHDVIPILKEINPDILQNITTTISNLNDTKSIVKESLKAVLKRAIISKTKSETVYDISEFKKITEPKAYLHDIFKVFGFTAFNDIYDLLDAQTGKLVKSKTHQLLKNRETLILTELNSAAFKDVQFSKESEGITTNVGNFQLDIVSQLPENKENNPLNTVFVDYELLNETLLVRNKLEGDYFYPIGMTGKKKLSKYFKDQKLSLIDKEKVLILCSNNQIVWVVNYRLDRKFKVSKTTKTILKITYTP
jgi:tRNA(Ile)-lysidine synthase